MINILMAFPYFAKQSYDLLPFFGECSIIYKPKRKILGLSKFPRFVAWASARPTTQEALTRYIREELERILETNVKVSMKCVHTCMRVRGALAQFAETTTESGNV
jgi:GTP cyclohydrolase I